MHVFYWNFSLVFFIMLFSISPYIKRIYVLYICYISVLYFLDVCFNSGESSARKEPRKIHITSNPWYVHTYAENRILRVPFIYTHTHIFVLHKFLFNETCKSLQPNRCSCSAQLNQKRLQGTFPTLYQSITYFPPKELKSIFICIEYPSFHTLYF